MLYLKDVYHTIKLSESFWPYHGILSYFGSASYGFQRMPMELSTTLVIWQSYINAIWGSIPDRSKYLPIISIFAQLKHGHLKYLDDLLKALLRNSLKISSRKCELFRTG